MGGKERAGTGKGEGEKERETEGKRGGQVEGEGVEERERERGGGWDIGQKYAKQILVTIDIIKKCHEYVKF